MKRHLFTAPLVASLLLLGTLGCSKKGDIILDNSGSYRLDNALIGCQSKASTGTAAGSGGPFNYLTIDLTPAPQPSVGPETLRLYFVKPSASASNAYTLSDTTLTSKGSSALCYFAVNAASLTTTSNGGFSGTFSGKIVNPSGFPSAPYTAITNGTFTNVRP